MCGFGKKNFISLAVAFATLIAVGHFDNARSAPLSKKSVVDRSGATVILPESLDRILITCYGGASHEIALLGGEARIIAQPTVELFTQFTKIYKTLLVVPDAGSFNDINIEHIVTLKPDIVIASIISSRGNERIEKMGIPVVTVGTGRTTIRILLDEFAMMGVILDAEDTAGELVDYWESRLSFIAERTGSLPQSKKKTVFYCSTGSPFTTEGSTGWGQNYIDASGGINVSGEVKNNGTVTSEQLLLWNPDVIIARTNSLGSPCDRTEEIRKLEALSAVRNNEIHYCPIGTFWWDRPSPEAILGILWLSKTLYPELMEDVDIKTETVAFYERFYQYRLTGTEYDSIMKR